MNWGLILFIVITAINIRVSYISIKLIKQIYEDIKTINNKKPKNETKKP